MSIRRISWITLSMIAGTVTADCTWSQKGFGMSDYHSSISSIEGTNIQDSTST
ncbi:hypothetical protein [Desulfosporosinus acidiphilus]|uniref:hypothetical protein n=1 Tax=Desulfosporosinus acidiphilus TaxID=885581 RepID=UPI001391864E|nr:hypothetical protein [Desulfosporosinus acidiphilus]